MSGLYKCSKCSTYKVSTEFYRDSGKSRGLASYCKPCKRSYITNYRKTNPTSIKTQKQNWDRRNQEHIRAYNTANRSKINATEASRRARLLNATPEWLTDQDRKDIEEYYILAQTLTEFTGIPHEVDHIHPLKGKNICGLHVPSNLQVTPQTYNRRKGNRFE